LKLDNNKEDNLNIKFYFNEIIPHFNINFENKAEILNKEKATGILIGLGNEGLHLSVNF